MMNLMRRCTRRGRPPDSSGTTNHAAAQALRPVVLWRKAVEAVSQTLSPATGRVFGLQRTCQALSAPRSTLYAVRARRQRSTPRQKRGPKTACTDGDLTEHIREVLARSPFVGEGYGKVWARLRGAGIRTSKGRVLRSMRGKRSAPPSMSPCKCVNGRVSVQVPIWRAAVSLPTSPHAMAEVSGYCHGPR
jgi:hypothetical protein